MKLRIKGNSLRLRVSPSELSQLIETGRVEEAIYFGEQDDAKLIYALEHNSQTAAMTLRYASNEIIVVLPTEETRQWAGNDQVGLYGEAGACQHRIEVVVEKDFACLDKGEDENADTFPNPKVGAAC